MLSFYKFFNVQDPEAMVVRAKRAFVSHDEIRGTLYVAAEGVNGQFMVPTRKLRLFEDIIASLDTDGTHLTDLDFNIGDVVNVSSVDPPPFRKLLIRSRDKILRDGLGVSGDGGRTDTDTGSDSDDRLPLPNIDWADAGHEVPPAEWHQEIHHLQTSEDDESAILLDCRNDYESARGSFKGAISLDTVVFSETWDKLERRLAGVDKHRRILTFCTGGIRCVKVNAYLKQRMGFNNVGRLEKGVIGYKAWLEGESIESAFDGENYVFDNRSRKKNQNRAMDDKGADNDNHLTA